jgi:hypothetical protein
MRKFEGKQGARVLPLLLVTTSCAQQPAPKPAAPAPDTKHAMGSSRPAWPAALPIGIPGEVKVQCTIDVSGVPRNCVCLHADPVLALCDSVLTWLGSGTARYHPAMRNGVPVAAQTTLTIHFKPWDGRR